MRQKCVSSVKQASTVTRRNELGPHSGNPHPNHQTFVNLYSTKITSCLHNYCIGFQIVGVQCRYTQKVDIAWLESDESIGLVTYQAFHKRRRDIRAVMVGDNAFAASCTAHEEIQRYDIRKGSENSYQRFELPETVRVKLKQLMERFDINFCSADFIENNEGTLLFVDLNVTGSWWWVDSIFDGRIADAITSQLLQFKAGQ